MAEETGRATERPWGVEANKIVSACYNIASVNAHRSTEGAANAALIVKAVNSFDALVAVVELIESLKSSPLAKDYVAPQVVEAARIARKRLVGEP